MLICVCELQRKTLDIITLFHKAGSPASTRVATLLKQAHAAAAATSTQDQASDHSAQTTNVSRPEFELNITEETPTSDQLRTILDYVGKKNISSVIKGAQSENEAIKIFKQNSASFQRPVVRNFSPFPLSCAFQSSILTRPMQVIDWTGGKAVAGDNESEILKLLNAKPKN